jgi:hypothetical protein
MEAKPMSAITSVRQIIPFPWWLACTFGRRTATRFTIVALHVLGLAATPTYAEPILLVEFTHRVITAEGSIPPLGTVPFRFVASEQFPPFVSWRDEYGPSDVGMTFSAPSEVVEGANSAFASPIAEYFLETGPANFSTSVRLPSVAGPSACLPIAPECLRTFVPDVRDYSVTSVERIVDELMITPIGGELYTLRATQRIQVFGVRIPEPGSIVLLIAALACFAVVRGTKRGEEKVSGTNGT